MFDFNVLLSTLQYMAKGMVGIFVVTILIVLSVYILNKLGSLGGKKDNDQNGQQ